MNSLSIFHDHNHKKLKQLIISDSNATQVGITSNNTLLLCLKAVHANTEKTSFFNKRRPKDVFLQRKPSFCEERIFLRFYDFYKYLFNFDTYYICLLNMKVINYTNFCTKLYCKRPEVFNTQSK